MPTDDQISAALARMGDSDDDLIVHALQVGAALAYITASAVAATAIVTAAWGAKTGIEWWLR